MKLADKSIRKFSVSDENIKSSLDKMKDPRDMNKEDAIAAVKKFLGHMNYTDYVERLADMMHDPKFAAVVNMVGSGKYSEDLFRVSKAEIPVTKLMPTQSEIDLDKSLKRGLQGGIKIHFKSPVVLGVPLLTLNGNYIIDGHHRWSQVLCFNPKATMTCINLESDLGPIATLKSAQLAIAGTQGKVNVAKVDGFSMYSISPEDLKKYISNNISDTCVEELREVAGIKSRDAAIKYILNNAMELKTNNTPVANAPKRDFMPQTDNSTAKAMNEGSVALSRKSFSIKDSRSFSEKSFSKITTEEEFREYAHNIMKNAHGDEYSEEVTNKVVDDLIKNNPDADYGELIGRLTSGFGDKSFAEKDYYIVTLKEEIADLREKKKDLNERRKSTNDKSKRESIDEQIARINSTLDGKKRELENRKQYLSMGRKASRNFASTEEGTVTIKTSNPKKLGELIQMIKDHGNGGHSFGCKIDTDGDTPEDWSWDGDGSDRIGDIEIEDVVKESRTFSISEVKTKDGLTPKQVVSANKSKCDELVKRFYKNYKSNNSGFVIKGLDDCYDECKKDFVRIDSKDARWKDLLLELASRMVAIEMIDKNATRSH